MVPTNMPSSCGLTSASLRSARAFAYAAVGDMKAAERTLRKLAETNPNLLAMFIGKKIHPLLERSAKQLFMRSGAVPRKMVMKRM